MIVKVRWFDDYFEEFEAVAVRSGAYMLWVKLPEGERWIQLSQVRWFDTGLNSDAVKKDKTTVRVRWFDGYYEEFEAVARRNGAYMLWIKLIDGERWIPLSQVRWFDTGVFSKR